MLGKIKNLGTLDLLLLLVAVLLFGVGLGTQVTETLGSYWWILLMVAVVLLVKVFYIKPLLGLFRRRGGGASQAPMGIPAPVQAARYAAKRKGQ